jgi:hypothetical protein
LATRRHIDRRQAEPDEARRRAKERREAERKLYESMHRESRAWHLGRVRFAGRRVLIDLLNEVRKTLQTRPTADGLVDATPAKPGVSPNDAFRPRSYLLRRSVLGSA